MKLIYKNLTGEKLTGEIMEFTPHGIKIKTSEFIFGLIPYKDVIEIIENK